MVASAESSSADWQWAEEIPGGGRALLWVPPKAERVRGALIGCQVVLEKTVLDDPRIREAAADLDLAMVLVVDSPLSQFNYDPNGKSRAADALEVTLRHLAQVSGYSEIAQVPLLPLGHSGEGNFVWRMAYANPGRLLGGIVLHAAPMTSPPPYDPKAKAVGVPLLNITGQWESWSPKENLDRHWFWVRGSVLDLRGRVPESLVGVVVQPGCGHFSWNETLAGCVAAFIRGAVSLRLPDRDGEPLRAAPETAGWLADSNLLDPQRHGPAPYAGYQGDRSLAFWYPDGETARRATAIAADLASKAPQMLTFIENGQPQVPAWCIDLKNLKPAADGITYQVQADFVTSMPTGTRDAGRPLGHAPGPGITFHRAGGNGGGGERVGADLFRVRYDQLGFSRNKGILVLASHPGDLHFAPTEIAAQILIPERIAGRAQTLHFREIPDLPRNGGDLTLQASSDAELPVSYAVLRGPVEVEGNRLRITRIPARARFPLTVTVAAWQRGQDGEDPVQTARPVEQSFHITNSK